MSRCFVCKKTSVECPIWNVWDCVIKVTDCTVAIVELTCKTCTRSIIQAGNVVSLRCCRNVSSETDVDALHIIHYHGGVEDEKSDNEPITMDVSTKPDDNKCMAANITADDPKKDGYYACLYRNCTSLTLDGYIQLSIDFNELLRPEFVCWVRNDYLDLTCRWSAIDEEQLTTRWRLSYKERLASHLFFA